MKELNPLEMADWEIAQAAEEQMKILSIWR